MTNELVKIVSDLKELFDSWTARKILNEEEFITELKKLNEALTEELKKPQPEQKTI